MNLVPYILAIEEFDLEQELWEKPEEIAAYNERLAIGLEALENDPNAKYRLVKDVFEKEAPDIETDKSLALAIHRYKQNFINRNREHAAFFGGNLLGVNVVRFVDADRDNWFDQIIQADEEILKEHLHRLPGINPEWHVSSNVMNLSCAYLAHRFFHSELPAAAKRQAMFDVFSILQFKFISSIMYRFFPYPADKQVAEATYAALNMKFILKEKSSWLGLLNHRCEEILSRSSPHYNAISSMNSDKEVVDMLNAIHGALKGYVKNMREVMERVRITGSKVNSTSSVAGVNGEEILKDKSRGPVVYVNYLKSILSDKNSFIREELLLVITKIMPSAKYSHLRAALEHLSDNYFKKDHQKIERIANLVMIHAFSYLADNRVSLRANVNLESMLIRLRGGYTSSRSTDVDLLELRTLVEEVIRPAVDSKTEAVISSVRTGVLMYLVSRAYTKNYYSGT